MILLKSCRLKCTSGHSSLSPDFALQLFLVEKAGRRTLHLLGLGGMAIGALVMTISLLLVSSPQRPQLTSLWPLSHGSLPLFFTRIWVEGHPSNELRGHHSYHVFRGYVWVGPRSNPVVHCGWAVLPGAPPCSHGCRWLLQLDRKFPCWNELPQTWGKGGNHWLDAAKVSFPFFFQLTQALVLTLAFAGMVRALGLSHLHCLPYPLLYLHLYQSPRDKRKNLWGDLPCLQWRSASFRLTHRSCSCCSERHRGTARLSREREREGSIGGGTSSSSRSSPTCSDWKHAPRWQTRRRACKAGVDLIVRKASNERKIRDSLQLWNP